MSLTSLHSLFFLLIDASTTKTFTLSLHDALPICQAGRQDRQGPDHRPRRRDRRRVEPAPALRGPPRRQQDHRPDEDRKSTRLNSSHANISYAVFCLKKKTKESKSNRATTPSRQLE